MEIDIPTSKRYPQSLTDTFSEKFEYLNCSCEIDSNATLYNVIITFLSKTKDINLKIFNYDNYKVNSKKDDDESFSFKKKIPFDVDLILTFDEKTYMINRIKQGKIVGTGGYAVQYELMTIFAKSSEDIEYLTQWAIRNREIKQQEPKSDIDIYIYEGCYWLHMTTQPKRDIDTIYLDDDIKNHFLNDIQKFFNDKKKYEKHGISYKRSYLLTGPPGTGKSSMIYAVASKFNLNIGIFKVTAQKKTLESAIKTIPKNTILLIEDIEHVFPTMDSDKEHKGINESDILNCLNGAFYKSGLLLFLTANNVYRIQKKMLRPGRIDYRLKFDYCNKNQIKQIYNAFIENGDAEIFYNQVKHLKLTPAILQTVLFNRDDDSTNVSTSLVGKKRKRDIISELEELVEEAKEDENHQKMIL